jgi:hypothetical protein
METYVFNANAAKQYRDMMGGGIDKYVFNVQDGSGIASFFAPIMRGIIPIIKSIGASAFGAAKPAARMLAREAIKGASSAALGSFTKKPVESAQRSYKPSRKRKASKSRQSRKRVKQEIKY